MSVKTVQAHVKQVTSQIEREMRRTDVRNTEETNTRELCGKLQRLEKVLYTVWNKEKQIRWTKWVRKLNMLDHSKATRAFYSELKRKNMVEEQLGPIVNESGELSTTLAECMTN